MLIQKNFAKRLNEILNLKRWKPVDLQRATGFGKSSISQYLSGVNAPRQNRLYILAKVLNVSEAWLMGYDVPMDRTPDALRSTSKYSNLPSKQRNILLQYDLLNLSGQEKVAEYITDLLENDKYKKDYETKDEENCSWSFLAQVIVKNNTKNVFATIFVFII